jgi:hypothetical protein
MLSSVSIISAIGFFCFTLFSAQNSVMEKQSRYLERIENGRFEAYELIFLLLAACERTSKAAAAFGL